VLPVSTPDVPQDDPLAELLEALNADAEQLTARLFTYLDCVVVARR
jgi:hypothetical protein